MDVNNLNSESSSLAPASYIMVSHHTKIIKNHLNDIDTDAANIFNFDRLLQINNIS